MGDEWELTSSRSPMNLELRRSVRSPVDESTILNKRKIHKNIKNLLSETLSETVSGPIYWLGSHSEPEWEPGPWELHHEHGTVRKPMGPNWGLLPYP